MCLKWFAFCITSPEGMLFQAPPEPKYVAFRGTGRTLGSAIPVTTSEPASTAPANLEAANQPSQGLVVDEAKPATSIQVNLEGWIVSIE